MNTLRTFLGKLMILTVGLAWGGWAVTARAELLFTDGDFNAQTIGSPVGAPWGPVGGGHIVTTNAQSIYDDVYPNNGKGVNFPTSGTDAYIVRSFPVIPASSTNLLYFNVDFRNNSAPGGIGRYYIVISDDGYHAERSVRFNVTGSTLYADTSSDPNVIGEAILTLQTNTWYNLQVTLDMGAKTYSGVVTYPTGSAVITNRPFVNTNFGIDRVFTDTSSYGGSWPNHDVDNWALSSTALQPLEPLRLWLSRQGNNIVLSWSGTAMLQSADQVAGPYVDVGAANPQTISPSAAQKFYRLRQSAGELLALLENDEMTVSVGATDGLIKQIESKQPTPVDVIASGTGGMTIYVSNLTGGWTDQFRATAAPVLTEVGGEKVVACSMALGSHNVAQADVTYRLSAEHLRVTVQVTYLQNDPSAYELGLYQRFNPAYWPNAQHWGKRNQGTHPSTTQETLMYSFAEGMSYDGSWGVAICPAHMLARNDRRLVWGYLDLGSYVVVAPNKVANAAPCFFVRPNGISAGNSYTFDFVMKVLPAPQNTFTEALRWYMQHISFSDADFSQGPVNLAHDTSRTMPEGNVALIYDHWLLNRYGIFTPGCSEATVLELEDRMLSLRMTNVWLMNWNDWTETSPTTGTIVNKASQQYTPQQLKGEIERLQNKGFKVFLYYRQGWWMSTTAFNSPVENPGPPYKRWMNRNPDDSYKKYGDFGDQVWVTLDWNNDEARNWYVQRVEQAVDFYQPDGIAWDMGWYDLPYVWGITTYYFPSAYDPNRNEHQGILKVQYEVFHWLREHHPDKYIISAGTGGTPGQVFFDGVGGEDVSASITESTYFEACKALNTATFSILYLSENIDYSQPAAQQGYVKKVFAGLAQGAGWSTAVFPLIQHDPTCTQNPPWNYAPFLLGMTNIAAFSAKTPATALVTNPRVVLVDTAGATGSAWADASRMLAAVYYEYGSGPQERVIDLDRSILGQYGHSNFTDWVVTVYTPFGIRKAVPITVNPELIGNWARLRVVLSPGELATIESESGF